MSIVLIKRREINFRAENSSGDMFISDIPTFMGFSGHRRKPDGF
jgi:hypothetical protein